MCCVVIAPRAVHCPLCFCAFAGVRYCTRIGNGPRHLTASDPGACLIDAATGLPRLLTAAEASGPSVPAASAAPTDSSAGPVGAAVAALAAQSAAQHRQVLEGLKSTSWVEDLTKFVALSAVLYAAATLVAGKCHNK